MCRRGQITHLLRTAVSCSTYGRGRTTIGLRRAVNTCCTAATNIVSCSYQPLFHSHRSSIPNIVKDETIQDICSEISSRFRFCDAKQNLLIFFLILCCGEYLRGLCRCRKLSHRRLTHCSLVNTIINRYTDFQEVVRQSPRARIPRLRSDAGDNNVIVETKEELHERRTSDEVWSIVT